MNSGEAYIHLADKTADFETIESVIPLLSALLDEGWEITTDKDFAHVSTDGITTRGQTGFKIHLSAPLSLAEAVLRRVVPIIVESGCPFRVRVDVARLKTLGEFITIFPDSEARFKILSERLLHATNGIKSADVFEGADEHLAPTSALILIPVPITVPVYSPVFTLLPRVRPPPVTLPTPAITTQEILVTRWPGYLLGAFYVLIVLAVEIGFGGYIAETMKDESEITSVAALPIRMPHAPPPINRTVADDASDFPVFHDTDPMTEFRRQKTAANDSQLLTKIIPGEVPELVVKVPEIGPEIVPKTLLTPPPIPVVNTNVVAAPAVAEVIKPPAPPMKPVKLTPARSLYVLSVRGRCLYSEDGTNFIKFNRYETIKPGATITTSRGGRADFFFRGIGTLVQLQEDAEIKLEDRRGPFLELRRGKIFVEVHPAAPGSVLEIRNAAGRCVIDGGSAGRYMLDADGSQAEDESSGSPLKVIGDKGVLTLAPREKIRDLESSLSEEESRTKNMLVQFDELESSTEKGGQRTPEDSPE